jgi:hypothetical protein
VGEVSYSNNNDGEVSMYVIKSGVVFIASREEDEGRITCGNAILSGTEPGSNQ